MLGNSELARPQKASSVKAAALSKVNAHHGERENSED